MKTKLAGKVTALAAACMLLLSGASAFAAPTGVIEGNPASYSSDAAEEQQTAQKKKCKKKNKKKKKCKKVEEGFVPGRVLELTYQGSAIGSADTPAINPWGLIAPVNFIPGMGENEAMIEIIDDNTPKASAGFAWDSDGDGLNDSGIDVCGETPEPVEMLTGTQYNVFPYLLPSSACMDGIATSGTIIVTFNKV